jgi:FAD/FMN-containing dehydrogenase
MSPTQTLVAPAILRDPTGLASLAAEIHGMALRPGDHDYDEARKIWNGMINRRPALTVHCVGTADVIAGVKLARKEGLPLAIRGGGHNVAGSAVCDDGFVVDLSAMKGIEVDSDGQTARTQPGLLWGEFDRETQVFGLATTGCIVTLTAIAGLTLGGDVGWLMRRHALTSDNLAAASVVTADGRLLRVSERENADARKA